MAMAMASCLAFTPPSLLACARNDKNVGRDALSRPHALSRRSLLYNAAAVAAGLSASPVETDYSLYRAVAKSAQDTPTSQQNKVAELESSSQKPPVQQQQQSQPQQQEQPQPRRITWGYVREKQNGPDSWASLSSEYAACGNYGTQSPVSIRYANSKFASPETQRPSIVLLPGKFVVRRRPAMPGAENASYMFDIYTPPPPPMVGDAPPIDVHRPPEPAAVMTVPGHGQFQLQNFHFHAPQTEHELDGRKGSLELHFVFQKMRDFPWIFDQQQPAQQQPQKAQQPSQQIDYPFSSSSSSGQGRPVVELVSFPSFGNGISGSASSVQSTSSAPSTSSSSSSSPSSSSTQPQPNASPSPNYNAAVLAVLFNTKSSSCPWLREVLDAALPSGEDVESFPTNGRLAKIDLSQIIPKLDTVDLYTYSGSLTTPPGTEGVFWAVVGKRYPASSNDVMRLMEAQGGPNVRPLQPLGQRQITRFPAKNDV